MAFNGTEGELITLKEAEQYTANHRNSMVMNDAISHYFGRNVIEQILAQPGCVGIRFYHGKEDNGSKNLVMVGANSAQNDMIDGLIANKSVSCPIICPDKNSLNS